MEKNQPQTKVKKSEALSNGGMVSVIVPVYNAESTLEKCLISLKDQIYSDFEAILIDDGSTDKSSEICLEICGEDSRFHYFRQDNQGVSAARNLGLQKAQGEFICFCDSDDWVEPNLYAELHRIICAAECDISICGLARHQNSVTEYFRPDREEYLGTEEIVNIFWEYQRRELWGSPCNKMYRRELIHHNFDLRMNCGEDMVFNMQYMSGKKRFGFTDKALYNVYSPVITAIKYPNMSAYQTYAFSTSLRDFLDSIADKEIYYSSYQRFLCDNFCRDTVTIALSKEFKEAERLIGQYYEYPDFREVLEKRIYMDSGWKYKMAGILLHNRRIKLLVALMKMINTLRNRRR